MRDQDSRVDAYIAQFSEEQQSRMKALRSLIHETVPQVRETIKYAMPTFLYEGDLIYFAANKNHTGLYPMPSGVSHFAEELLSYHTSKGAIRFPLDRALPLDLIRRIILFRVEENERKQEEKKHKNKK
ncbi:MAG TPA: hypothetical protein DCG32_08180 [Sphaerochaeta sp.]|jgi:uncharacterized protein YdhG (YjbR/CyaY superfamily)|nr:hypothetical protein [Sphaerochaeta sp.]